MALGLLYLHSQLFKLPQCTGTSRAFTFGEKKQSYRKTFWNLLLNIVMVPFQYVNRGAHKPQEDGTYWVFPLVCYCCFFIMNIVQKCEDSNAGNASEQAKPQVPGMPSSSMPLCLTLLWAVFGNYLFENWLTDLAKLLFGPAESSVLVLAEGDNRRQVVRGWLVFLAAL